MTFDSVMTALLDFKGLLQEVCQEGFVSVYQRGKYKRLASQYLVRVVSSAVLGCLSFAVRDVTIVEHENPAVELQTRQLSEGQAAVQAGATSGQSATSV